MKVKVEYIGEKTAAMARHAGFDPRKLEISANYKLGEAFVTQSVLQSWILLTYYLHITIFSSSQESWMYRITKPHQKLEDGWYGEDYADFEEALEEALQKCLHEITN